MIYFLGSDVGVEDDIQSVLIKMFRLENIQYANYFNFNNLFSRFPFCLFSLWTHQRDLRETLEKKNLEPIYLTKKKTFQTAKVWMGKFEVGVVWDFIEKFIWPRGGGARVKESKRVKPLIKILSSMYVKALSYILTSRWNTGKIHGSSLVVRSEDIVWNVMAFFIQN